MKRLGSLGFWLLVFVGGAWWLYDVVDRLNTAEDPGRVWRVLLVSVGAGALLEGFFLILRYVLIRSLSSRIRALDKESDARVALWGNRFGNWTGALTAALVGLLVVGAWVDWFDPLTPIAFLVGFAIAWVSVGGHQYHPTPVPSE